MRDEKIKLRFPDYTDYKDIYDCQSDKLHPMPIFKRMNHRYQINKTIGTNFEH